MTNRIFLGPRQERLLRHLANNGAKASTQFPFEVQAESLYKTLRRLEDLGYTKSYMSKPEHRRGGKAKRMFLITEAGQEALERHEAWQ